MINKKYYIRGVLLGVLASFLAISLGLWAVCEFGLMTNLYTVEFSWKLAFVIYIIFISIKQIFGR